jgi:hypothetical protein
LAEVLVANGLLSVKMSRLERLFAFHGNFDVPVTQLSAVDAVDDPWAALRGTRSPGTGIPGVIAYGPRRVAGAAQKDFAMVKGKGPAIRLAFTAEAEFGQVLVSVPSPQGTVDRARQAMG